MRTVNPGYDKTATTNTQPGVTGVALIVTAFPPPDRSRRADATRPRRPPHRPGTYSRRVTTPTTAPGPASTGHRPRPALGVLLVAVSGVLFAVNGTVSKLILEAGVDAPHLTLLRAAGSCLTLLVLVAVTGPGLGRLRLRRHEAPRLIAYGLAGFFLVPMLYFVAIARLPVGIALLFEYMAPVLIALWARFGRRERVRSRLWYGLVACLCGLGCVAEVWRGGLTLSGVGVAAGLGAAVMLCAFYVLGSTAVNHRDSVSLTCWAFGVAAVAGLVWAVAAGGTDVFPVGVFARDSHGVPVWALTTYLILAGSVASYLLVALGLTHLPPTSVGIIGMIEPVVAAGVAWSVLAERLSFAQLAGGGLVLVGVAVAETARTAGPADVAEIPPN
jgi:drug/metabolite transporter (DMT)-like permease